MKTVAFVPIKLNNERLQGKNLLKFNDGTPLIHLIQKNLRNVYGIDEIYLFCSNDSIKQYILQDIHYLRRSPELDTKETRCNDLIRAFTQKIDADIYVMAHATSPFVTSLHITECLNAVKSGQYDSAYAAVKMQNFVWFKEKPLNFDIANNLRTQDMKPIFIELSTPFVFTNETFKKSGGRTGDNPYCCECSFIEGIDIDYYEDFELANIVYTYLIKEKINYEH